MRIALVCILLGFLIPTTNACSQEGGSSKSELQPEIVLGLLPIDLVDGVPQGFVFVLTNVSGADLRLPQPDIDCSNRTPQGTILLDEFLVPRSGQALGKGVGSCDFGGWPGQPQLTMPERAKRWIVLHPKKSLRISANLNNLHYETSRPGIYTFSATYFPPLLSPEDQRSLLKAGIVIPHQKAISVIQRYSKP